MLRNAHNAIDDKEMAVCVRENKKVEIERC